MLNHETAPVVVITGASAGVGRATAVAFGRMGWRVALLARGQVRLESARLEVEQVGGRALALPVDVADPVAIETAAERVERELGPIDVWINVAMATVFSPFDEVTPDEYRRVTEVTYLGQVYGAMSALKRMRTRDRGTIVNVSSALAYHGLPLQSAYCGAKFAGRGFTESLRGELIHDGSRVRVSMVVLPAVNTPQFDWARNKLPRRPQPAPPIYEPEVAARAVVRAALSGRREIVVGRSALQLLLGSMLVPGWVTRRLAQIAYGAQQTSEEADHGRPDNLFHSVAGDFGAHGRFANRASPRGLTVTGGQARGSLLLAALALLAGAFFAGKQWRKGSVARRT